MLQQSTISTETEEGVCTVKKVLVKFKILLTHSFNKKLAVKAKMSLLAIQAGVSTEEP